MLDIWVVGRTGPPQDIYRVYIGTVLIWTETAVVAEPYIAAGYITDGYYEDHP